MKPAALARLLKLVAVQAGTDPRRIAGALELPPETARLLAEMLAPGPGELQDAATAPSSEPPPALELARLMAEPDDAGDLKRQVAVASPSLSASRALATAVAVSRKHADADTVSCNRRLAAPSGPRRRVPSGARGPPAPRRAVPAARPARRGRLGQSNALGAGGARRHVLGHRQRRRRRDRGRDSRCGRPRGRRSAPRRVHRRRRPYARPAAAGAARHERVGPRRRAHPASHRASSACDRHRAHARSCSATGGSCR